jgi:hypothetical protein
MFRLLPIASEDGQLRPKRVELKAYLIVKDWVRLVAILYLP